MGALARIEVGGSVDLKTVIRFSGRRMRASEAPDPDTSGDWEPFIPNPHVPGINN